MAIITAAQTGNWSSTSTWTGSVLPTTGDTVRPGAFTVTIDQNVDLGASGTLEGNGSGHFAVTAARTIVANVLSGTGHSGGGVVRCSHTTGTVTINGNVTAGPNIGVSISGAGSAIAVVGNVTGGSASGCHGISIAAATTLVVTGNVTAGVFGSSSAPNAALGIYVTTGGTVTVNGNTAGNTGNFSVGIYNASTATVTISGTCTGGAGAGAFGAQNVANGTVRVGTAVGNDYGPGGTHVNSTPGLQGSNISGAITTFKALQFGAKGQSPIGQCAWCEHSLGNNIATLYRESGATVALTDVSATVDYPAQSNVRNGTVYANGTRTGTAAIPSASNVALGIAVDNTTGTAVLTPTAVENAVWNATRSGHTADGTYGDTAEWAGGGTPPTVVQIRQEMDANSTQLAKLGVPAGVSLAADIAAVKSDTAAVLDDTGTSGVVVAVASKTGYALSADQSSVTVGTVNALGTTARGQVNTEADTALADVGVTTTVTGRIDASISSRGTSTLTTGDIDARLSAYDAPTKAELDSAVAPLATQTSIDALAGYVDTEVAAILAAVDTEIAAIKAKTDNLPASPAATSDIPGTAAIAAAIMAHAVESGHDLTTVLRAAYAILRGRSVANDADNPTAVTYYAPDNTTVRVTHALSDTERTVA